MATIAARLNSSGTLYASNGVVFNEINQSNISITPSGVFAYQFDEVSGTLNNRAMQQYANGVVKVSGVFDEVTGIA
jgi:hypothetical protein